MTVTGQKTVFEDVQINPMDVIDRLITEYAKLRVGRTDDSVYLNGKDWIDFYPGNNSSEVIRSATADEIRIMHALAVVKELIGGLSID